MKVLTHEECVTQAAEWLDNHHPGWERKIDLSTLDILDPCNCILGQTLKGLVGCIPGYTIGMDQIINKGGDHYPNFVVAFVSARCEPIWAELIKERFNSGILSDEK